MPEGVEIDFKGTHMTVKGGRGQLELDVHPEMKITIEDSVITVARPTDQTRHRALHGLTRSLIANMVEGVSKGFRKELELVGVGYRASKQGDDLVLNVGYSHPVKYIPPGHHHRGPGADPDQHLRHRQGAGGPHGLADPQGPPAGALQGQGHPLQGRAHQAQGRQVR